MGIILAILAFGIIFIFPIVLIAYIFGSEETRRKLRGDDK